VHHLSKTTDTPSGVQHHHQRSNVETTGTGEGPAEGCTYSDSSKGVFHVLTKDGEVHVRGGGGGESSAECRGAREHWEYSSHDHYANGRQVFQRGEVDCRPF
jgi:hypothetical protein